jgi:hypothetical protein
MRRRSDLDKELVSAVEKVLHNASVASVRSWLKAKNKTFAASTRASLIERVARLIEKSEITFADLEDAIVGIEEAGGKVIFLYGLEGNLKSSDVKTALEGLKIDLATVRTLAKPLPQKSTLAYAQLKDNLLRMKWSETHRKPVPDFEQEKLVYEKVTKVIVLVANLATKSVEIRYDKPETFNPHNSSPRAHKSYFDHYVHEATNILTAPLLKSDLQKALTKLIEDEPSLVRLHRGGHTNQRNAYFSGSVRDKTSDIRHDDEYKAMFSKRGKGWAYEDQSFYWLPERSDGVLTRQVFSHVDAVMSSIRVDADCWDAEVDYAIHTIRKLQ